MKIAGNRNGFETDVLIIGAGPTGSTAALALATYGVKAHMVSRQSWLANSPRAHITNQRAMEVLRDLNVEKECRLHATPWEQMGEMLFTTSFAGKELVRLRAWGRGDERIGDYISGSPCPLIDLIQPEIEPILLKNAAERGATFSFNTEYLGHEQDDAGVQTFLRDRLTGQEYVIRSRYLIGADGARSKVLEDLGLTIEGELNRAGMVHVLFDADLERYAAHRAGMLHWVISDVASLGEIGMGLIRAIRPWKSWLAGWGFDLEKGEPDVSEDRVLEKIKALIGDDSIKVEILKTSIWYVNQAYAPEYAKGRVFCAGDAVHRHPPSSGLGLNTCVQDAFNLAWKLAYVIAGHAGDRLLETYSRERAPIGKQIVQRANQSRLDYGELNAAFRVEGAEHPVRAGIARFRDLGPEGIKARKAVQQALALKNTEFNAQGVEMNQRYVSSCVLSAADCEEELWGRDPQLYLQPASIPGAKIPHVWLIDAKGNRISTLDIVGKGRFTLITGLSGQAWVKASKLLSLPYLRTVVIGEADVLDIYCDWQRIRDVDEAGALLVRPDGYIAWRAKQSVESVEQATKLLSAALQKLLDVAKLAPNEGSIS